MARFELNKESIQRLQDDMIRLAVRSVRNAKKRCPVDTGRLRSSITFVKLKPLGVKVGTPVTYARHVEYGTVYQTAQPYLRPAIREELANLRRGGRNR